LVSTEGHDPATEEPTIVGLVIEYVLVAARHVAGVGVPGVVQPAVRVYPEHEVGLGVSQFLDRVAAATEPWCEELE
jgi:hypothetical protein